MDKNDSAQQVEQEHQRAEKKPYEAPNCESYQPLDIMSAWEDKSSELP